MNRERRNILKREALAEFHRGRILATAKELFAQNGVDATGMDEIAAKADYSKSTIYVYFSGKEDIFYNIVLEDMKQLRYGIQGCLEKSNTLDERYHAICELLTAFDNSDPTFFAYVFGKISVDEADFARLPVLKSIYEAGEEINVLSRRLFSEAVTNGEASKSVRPVETGLIYWNSIGSLIAFSANKESYFQEKLGFSREEFLQYAFKLLLGAVKTGE